MYVQKNASLCHCLHNFFGIFFINSLCLFPLPSFTYATITQYLKSLLEKFETFQQPFSIYQIFNPFLSMNLNMQRVDGVDVHISNRNCVVRSLECLHICFDIFAKVCIGCAFCSSGTDLTHIVLSLSFPRTKFDVRKFVSSQNNADEQNEKKTKYFPESKYEMEKMPKISIRVEISEDIYKILALQWF